MKTKRRHDLETNLLARKLAGWISHIKPYTNAMTVVVVAVAVVLVGWFFLSRQAAEREAMAWNDYFLATVDPNVNPAKLRETAQQHSGSPVAHWANLAWADRQLQAGTQALFIDKTQALKSLNAAIDAYRLLETSGAADLIRERASFGLARAYESMGRVDDAERQYLMVRGTFAPLAKARVDALERPEIRQFYDWFANAEPPTRPMTGEPGIPGQRPLFDLEGGDVLDTGLLPGFGLGFDDDSSTTAAPPAGAESPSSEPPSEPQPDQPQ